MYTDPGCIRCVGPCRVVFVDIHHTKILVLEVGVSIKVLIEVLHVEVGDFKVT